MARMDYGTWSETTRPRWAGDFRSRDHLIPGGVKLDASAFTADADGKKFIPSGTAVGRTIAERDSNAAYGPAADTDDEVYLLAFDVDDAVDENDGVLYRPGSVVKENLLPGSPSAAVLGAIRDAYVCQRGVA